MRQTTGSTPRELFDLSESSQSRLFRSCCTLLIPLMAWAAILIYSSLNPSFAAQKQPLQSASPTSQLSRSSGSARSVEAAGSDDRPNYLNDVMSANASELADMIQITPLLNKLQKEQQSGKLHASKSKHAELQTEARLLDSPAVDSPTAEAKSLAGDDLAHIVNNQRLIYLRTQINAYLQTSNLEVASVIGRLNSGLAELADRKAMISDQRARTLRRQSFINFVSGGLTKIGGYSIALTPSSLIPTNILEIFDGTVQVSLSAFTLKQQRDEQKLSKARPAILNAFLTGNNLSTQEFPPSVWTYLNRASARTKSSKTRRQELIDHWNQIGRLTDGTNKLMSRAKAKGIAPSFNENFHLDDLDDTVAMMSDLKSVVSGMENAMMELGQTVRDSYKDDPEI
jgi:hypothetical protein